MKFNRKKSMGVLFVLLLVFLVAAGAAYAGPEKPKEKPDKGLRTYQVTITNLLDEGQAFTPPVVVLHRRPVHLFEVGDPASHEISQIAENGNLDPMVAFLESHKHIADFEVAVAGDPPPLLPGQAVTIELTADPSAKYISFASMLICTNDGFTGLDALRVPIREGETVTAMAAAYDAGSEINTEDFADLVPPCPVLSGVDPAGKSGTGMSNPALAENGVIHHHQGIQGQGEPEDGFLNPDVHGWDTNEPVAEVVVTRID